MNEGNFTDPACHPGLAIAPATERAWAAGFFDGEGNIRWTKYNRGGGNVMLSVVNCEMEPLERFHAAISGLGGIYKRSRASQPAHWSQSYVVRVTRLADTERAISLLWEFLSGPKRRQAERAFADRAAFRATWPADFVVSNQKLSDAQVTEIRTLIELGGQSQASIARQFGVSQGIVSKIKLSKRRVTAEHHSRGRKPTT